MGSRLVGLHVDPPVPFGQVRLNDFVGQAVEG